MATSRTRIRGAIAGAALALLAISAVHYPLARVSVPLLSLFLALTACVYLGALLAQTQRPAVVAAESAVALVVFVCAALGTLASAGWLAAGYAVHGLWDWAHDAGSIATRAAPWFPPACAVFDILIALFILLLVV